MSNLKVVATSSDDDVVRMCQLYWETQPGGEYSHKISSLARDYSIQTNEFSRTVAQHSYVEVLDLLCTVCAKPRLARTRSELTTVLKYTKQVCDECKIAEKERLAEQSEASVRAMRKEIAHNFAVRDDVEATLEVSDLGLVQAFTLAALLEDGDYVAAATSFPLIARGVPVGPTSAFELDLVTQLAMGGMLLIHPDSPIDAFVWKGSNVTSEYYPSKAKFYLPGTGPLDRRVTHFLASFGNTVRQEHWPIDWHDELPAFWSDLAASDCEAYFVACLMRRRLDLNPGNRTRDAIRRGLEWFTVGQMYYFIWRAAAYAGDYYAQGAVSRAQAANSAVSRLASSIEKAYTDNWSVTTYQRQSGDEPSTLWRLLTVRALNLSDPMSYSPSARRRSATALNWPILSSESFERLVFTMVDEAEGYEEVQWLMRTEAPDHGRDVSAVRLTRDALSGYRQFRVVIQCKHWLSKSLTDKHIAAEVVSVEHWQNPPFDVLVIATSGRFTADAVTWVERHNSKGQRPFIELWNDAHLESLLSERPNLILQYRLR